MLLSVVIVNWNAKDLLAACLASLETQTYPELEVIVVDNGSADGSSDMVAARFPSVKLLEAGANLGFAEGCNRGLAIATGAWVAMLNNDAVADPEWAAALMAEAARAEARVGSLQSMILFRDRPDVVNSTGIELRPTGSGRDRDEGKARSDCSAPAEIFCPTAGAAAYRRAMLDELKLAKGYFDSTYFMYLEDLDLGWRARLAGWSSLFVPSAIVHHVWHGTSHRHGKAWLRVMSRANRVRTLLKNASLPLLAANGLNMVGAGLEVVYYGGLAGPNKLLAAVRDGLRGRREVNALASQDRRSVERRWISRGG
jgi:GT2 family glycosyltransferase